MKDALTKFNEDAYVDTFGAVRWNSNDRIPFDDMLEEMAAAGAEFNMTECQVTRKIEEKAFLAEYIEARKNISEEQKREEAYERRAAFGPGETIVNIITGETYKT